MSATPQETIEEGRRAHARHDWQQALDVFSDIDSSAELDPEDLERLGEAAFWLGRLPDAIGFRERSAAGYNEAGNRLAAARVSIAIASNHFWRRNYAVGGGWFNKAQRLLESEPETSVHGELEIWRIHILIARGKLEEALEVAQGAFAIGQRLNDPDLQAHALSTEGSVRIRLGQVTEGMALIDESMASAVAGELGPLATALIYCTTISACHRVGDYRRAAEWTDAVETCAVNPGRSDFPGDCHAHRVGVLHMHGKWDEAEREGEKAIRVAGQEETHVGMALYEVGEILLRRGELDRAEETFQRAEDMGRTPQPGRALLLLARGKGKAAVSSIAGALADESWDRLARGRLLPGAVEVAIGTRELERARAAADELETIATSYGTTALGAAAQVAQGSVLHAEGSAEAAAYFRKACQLWQEVDAPYEVARARLALAEVLSAGGDIEGGAAEARVARTLFERLGTLPDISRAQALQARAEGTHAAAAEATSRSIRSFMFTDIVGSTSLIEAIGDDAWASLVRWHDQALRAQFKAHAGEEIDNAGDGFFVAFEDAERAIACAVEIQRALASQRESQGFAPQVRIGLHTAEATRQGEGYTGSGVHRAARIGALAGGGEILISTQTLEGTGGSFEISGARTVELKGMSEPANIARVVWDHR